MPIFTQILKIKPQKIINIQKIALGIYSLNSQLKGLEIFKLLHQLQAFFHGFHRLESQ